MSLERQTEISRAAEQHSSTVFNEVFAQMQAAVSVKAKKTPSDFIHFTNIYSADQTRTKSTAGAGNATKDTSSILQQVDGEQFVIKADGSILLNCYPADDAFRQ